MSKCVSSKSSSIPVAGTLMLNFPFMRGQVDE